jgi:hypothetical protein
MEDLPEFLETMLRRDGVEDGGLDQARRDWVEGRDRDAATVPMNPHALCAR